MLIQRTLHRVPCCRHRSIFAEAALRSRANLQLSVLLFAVVACLSACGSKSSGGSPAPTAPAISSQPTTLTVTTGQTATFTVGATGTAPLTYQWYVNTASVGTNSSTLAIMQTPAS